MQDLSENQRIHFERIIESFENAWHRGDAPKIDGFLPEDSEWRCDLLVELVHIDVEFRRKSGQIIGIDEYLNQFPELAKDHAALQSLQETFDLSNVFPQEMEAGVAADSQLTKNYCGGVSNNSPRRSDHKSSKALRASAMEGKVGQENPPDVRFQILRPHARGGLGQVSLAFDKELQREVALKEIQPRHADDSASRERFMVEAAITGSLEHPGIVPIYGLGRYTDGRPYYAMRFVRGESLKAAIDAYHHPDSSRRQDPSDRQLEFRQLLGRFVDVCNTIEYVHSRHIVHRDLKPANIMLGKFGETLVVDWGLAKHISEPQQDSSSNPMSVQSSMSSLCQTQDGFALGTPAYMSPEQAAGQLNVVGPASDIYGLGATLYHILTGRPPVDESTTTAAIEKVKRGDYPAPRACQVNVPRPLEAVALKAMALSPADRYPNAKSLANEIERWLADEPVQAYRESWLGKFSRWGRGHRALVGTAAALLFTSLVATTIVVFAVGSERERTLRASQQAEIHQRTTSDVAELLQQLFRTADPIGYEGFGLRGGKQKASEVTVQHLLDSGAQEVSVRLKESPEVQASLFETIGNSYRGMGNYAKAKELLQKSLEIRRSLFGEDSAVVASSLFSLGILSQDTGKYDEAEQLYRQALDLQIRLSGPTDLAVARTEFQLGWILTQQPFNLNPNRTGDRHREAEVFLRDALAIRREKLGKNHHDVGITLASLAGIKMELSDEKEAQALLIEAFGILDQPENASDIGSATAYFIQGETLRKMKMYKEGAAAHQKVVEITRRQLGDTHPMLALMLATLAGTQHQAGDLEGAEKNIRETLAIARLSSMRSQPKVLEMFIRLADGLRTRNDFIEAESIYREVIQYGQEGDSVATAALVGRARQQLDEMTKQP